MNTFSFGTLHVTMVAALFLHGIAHAIALVAIIGQIGSVRYVKRIALQIRLLKGLKARNAAMIALPFWALSTMAFLGSTAALWGVILPTGQWELLALAGALISTAGIVLTGGVWPGSPSRQRSIVNTGVALSMNVLILSARIWLQWLPSTWIFANL